jgi:hypothetical protein
MPPWWMPVLNCLNKRALSSADNNLYPIGFSSVNQITLRNGDPKRIINDWYKTSNVTHQ